jgi:hypothetical protein
MHDLDWYAVDALMADLTSKRFRVWATSQEDAERKTRDRSPGAAAIIAVETFPTLRPPLSRGDGSGGSL